MRVADMRQPVLVVSLRVARSYHAPWPGAYAGVTVTERRVNGMTERSLVVLLNTDDDLISGERLLKSRTEAAILRLGPALREYTDPADIVRVRDVSQLRAWLRSSRRRPASSWPDVHNQAIAGLASMRVRLPNVLSSGQDQIFVLDREQRIVAFFGHWPKESPRRLKDLLGKRKRDLFGPNAAAVHEAAVLRALNGEEAAYEWSITDVPQSVHLFTAASPLRNDDGVVAGVLLVLAEPPRVESARSEHRNSPCS